MQQHQIAITMPMYLTTLSKRGFACVYLSFLALFAVSVIIGFLGPDVYTEFKETTKGDPTLDMSINTTRFTWQIDGLDKLNQELWLTAKIQNLLKEGSTIQKEMEIFVYLEGAVNSTANFQQVVNYKAKRYLTCPQNSEFCTDLVLFDLPFIKYQSYRVTVGFPNVDAELNFIGYVDFIWSTINHKYTLYELWFRFAFLLMSFVTLFLFCFRLRKFKFSDWSLEQKWICALIITLMGYDNPFFPLQVLMNSWLPGFIDALLTSTFIACLFLFWLCYFDGIRKVKTRRSTLFFYGPKVGLIFVFWVAFIVIFTWQTLHQLDNPTYAYVNDNPLFVFFVVLCFLVGIVYTGWFLYVLVRAANERGRLPLLQLQLVFMGVFTLIVFIIMILGLAIGFYGVVENSAAEWLSLYSLFNIYVMSLAVVWAPSGDAFKPEATAPMTRLEDSDDEAGPNNNKGRPSAAGSAASAPPPEKKRGEFSSEEDEKPGGSSVKSGAGSSVAGSAKASGGFTSTASPASRA